MQMICFYLSQTLPFSTQSVQIIKPLRPHHHSYEIHRDAHQHTRSKVFKYLKPPFDFYWSQNSLSYLEIHLTTNIHIISQKLPTMITKLRQALRLWK